MKHDTINDDKLASDKISWLFPIFKPFAPKHSVKMAPRTKVLMVNFIIFIVYGNLSFNIKFNNLFNPMSALCI